MLPDRVGPHASGSSAYQPFNPSSQPAQGTQLNAAFFQQYAPRFPAPYAQPMASYQMVPVLRPTIIGYNTVQVIGADGTPYLQNTPVYGPSQIVYEPWIIPNHYYGGQYPPEEEHEDYPEYETDGAPEEYYEDYSSQEGEGALEEQSRHTTEPETRGDLALPADSVGHTALAQPLPLALSQILSPSAATEEFFGASSSLDQEISEQAPAKSEKTPEEILDGFLALVKAGDKIHYRREYLQMVQKFKSDSKNDKKWENAMLHNPPRGLLLNLNKIAYFVKPKDEEKSKKLTTFLFPLRIEESPRMSKTLKQNKEKMCLELAVKTNGRAEHIFLRALKDDDQLRDRVLGENRQNVEGSLFQSAFPSFEEASHKKTKAKAVSPQNPVVDEGIDLRFYSEYGAHILAKKKD